MPNCRECGARISRFDKDRCPICGAVEPLEGISSETVEITSQFELGNQDLGKISIKKRSIFLVLSLFFGFLGVGLFYLKYTKKAIMWLIVNLCIILGVLLPVGLFSSLGWLWAVLIPAIIVYVINIALAIALYFIPNFKDGNGEFVR